MAVPFVDSVTHSLANARDLTMRRPLADVTPTPSTVIDEGPQRTVHHYDRRGRGSSRSPVLLVPPLAAPASCFDLRRGCSLAEHLTSIGYPTYLVDYGPISFADRELGLEHWVEDVIPTAVRAVAADAGGAAVKPIGWCLGGIMTLFAVAADPELPVASVSLVASPFDFEQVRLVAPVRQLANLTGGALGTALYRMLGGVPAPLVSLGFQLTALDRYLTKPWFVARNIADRETLAHAQAVDAYMRSMLAYPGRTFGQLYHAFFRVNDVAGGVLKLPSGSLDLASVRQPVLAVAGQSDVLAPEAAVHHLGGLLPNAKQVVLETAPGGHLGVLTGRSAKGTTWVRLDQFLERDAVAGGT